MKKALLLLAMSTLIITGTAQTRRTNVKKTAQKPKVTNVARKTATVDIKALTDTLRDLKHQVKMEQMKLCVYEKPLVQKLSDGTTFKFIDCWQNYGFVYVKFEVCNMEDSPRLKIQEKDITGIADDKRTPYPYLYRGESSILDRNRIDLNQGVTDNLTVSLFVSDDITKVINQLKIYEENSNSFVDFREIPVRHDDGSIASMNNSKSLQDSVMIMKSYLKNLKKRNGIRPIQTQKLADGTVFELISCTYDQHSYVTATIRIFNYSRAIVFDIYDDGPWARHYTFEGESNRGYLYDGYNPSRKTFTIDKNIYSNLFIKCYIGDRLPKTLEKIELEIKKTNEKVIFNNIKVER